MELKIDNKANLNLTRFCKALILDMGKYIRESIDKQKLIKYDKFLNDSFPQKQQLSSYQILVGSVYNIRILKKGNRVELSINPNTKIPFTNLKYINIVSLINYGNTSLQAYPVLTEMFEHYTANLPKYYRYYEEGWL